MIHKELNHVNVVKMHHYFEDNLNVYMLLEACPRKVSRVTGAQFAQIIIPCDMSWLYKHFAIPPTSPHRRCLWAVAGWKLFKPLNARPAEDSWIVFRIYSPAALYISNRYSLFARGTQSWSEFARCGLRDRPSRRRGRL
jgi:hypothetical protein